MKKTTHHHAPEYLTANMISAGKENLLAAVTRVSSAARGELICSTWNANFCDITENLASMQAGALFGRWPRAAGSAGAGDGDKALLTRDRRGEAAIFWCRRHLQRDTGMSVSSSRRALAGETRPDRLGSFICVPSAEDAPLTEIGRAARGTRIHWRRVESGRGPIGI